MKISLPILATALCAADAFTLNLRSLLQPSSSTSLMMSSNDIGRRQFFIGAGAIASSLFINTPQNAAVAAGTQRSFPEWTLDNNVKMPTLALNTVGLSVEDTERAVGYAIEDGFTHVDFHPGKERDGVAKYIANNPSKRKDLFLNTKIRKPKPGTSASQAAALAKNQIEEDLKALNLNSVDMLMLRDSPDCDVMQAQWAVLEEALAAGKTRSIGVINYCEGSLKCLLETAKVKPALNYYMLHVGMGEDAHGLRTFCDSNGIRTFAYGAVGEPGPNDKILTNPVLQKIGANHGNKSTEEVALRWVIQSGAAVSVRPTTNFGLGSGICTDAGDCATGLKKRAGVFNWSLSEAEMAELDSLTEPDDNPTLFSSSGCPGSFVMPK